MAKPSVDALEEDLSHRIAFTRVNVKDDGGSAMAHKYGIRGVPAFLLLSPKGDVLYRKIGGKPDRDQIEEELAALK
jgi:hypothetical protein